MTPTNTGKANHVTQVEQAALAVKQAMAKAGHACTVSFSADRGTVTCTFRAGEAAPASMTVMGRCFVRSNELAYTFDAKDVDKVINYAPKSPKYATRVYTDPKTGAAVVQEYATLNMVGVSEDRAFALVDNAPLGSVGSAGVVPYNDSVAFRSKLRG